MGVPADYFRPPDSQFLSGTQTRRIGPLLTWTPSRSSSSTRTWRSTGHLDGAWATAETRRGSLTLRARVVATIRPDTIFVL